MKKGTKEKMKEKTFDTDSLFVVAFYNVVTSCECRRKYWELERMTQMVMTARRKMPRDS